MRISVLATVILLSKIVPAAAAPAEELVFVHVRDIQVAPLLKLSAEVFRESAYVDPALGKRRISVDGKFPSQTAYFQHIAHILGTVARRDPSGIHIGKSTAEPQLRVPAQRDNYCPYRYPDLQAAIQAMLPDRLRICQPLEYFPLQTLQILGILSQGNQVHAFVASPDGATWSIKRRDYLGQDLGMVVGITPAGIDLREIKQDENGEWQEIQVLLPLK